MQTRSEILEMTTFEKENSSDLIRLKPINAKDYIGHDVLFFTRGKNVIRKIKGVSLSGESVSVDHPDLKNSLNITRVLFAVKNTKSD